MSELRGPTVVSGWGIGNAVLLGILIGYGDGAIPTALYAGSVALIEVIGLIAWWILLRHADWAGASPAPRAGRASVLAATVAVFVGIGLVWNLWFMIPAAYPALALVGELVEALSSPKREPPPKPDEPAAHSVLAGELVATAVAGAAATAGWRWWARRRR